MRKKTIFIFCLSVLFFFNISGFADSIKDDIASGIIPLPSDAKPFGVSGSGVTVRLRSPSAIYVTSLDKRQLIRFYIRELSKRGWKSSGTIASMIEKYNIPLQGDKLQLKDNLKNAVEFYNSSKSLLLFVLPPRSGQKETIFSLAYIQSPPLGAPSNLNTLPDYIPVYPGAALTTRVGNGFVYSTNDNIESVINFYKNNMLAYGWQIYNEMPLTEKKVQFPRGVVDSLSSLSKQCPACEQNETSSMPEEYKLVLSKGTFIVRTMYKFKRDGEICHITLSSVKIGETYKGTSIIINYNP